MSQGIMISEQDELTVDQVVSPMFDSLHYRIELNIISRVTPPSSCKFLAVISIGTSFLAKNCAYTQLGGITVQLKSSLEIW